jgi:uncharacterized protein DUF5615
VKGILADINTSGPIDDLVRQMRKEPWDEFWNHLGLTLFHFQELGLTPTSSDLEIWQTCQTHGLVLITNNRNARSSDSLESPFGNIIGRIVSLCSQLATWIDFARTVIMQTAF